MKFPLLLLFCCLFPGMRSQHKIYFTDGSVVSGKIIEIGVYDVKIATPSGEETFSKIYVALLDLGDHGFEHYNDAKTEIVVKENGMAPGKTEPLPGTGNPENLLAFNTAGLVNSDISFSYERLLYQRRLGAGIFGSYNFNTRVNALFNSYIFPLHNSRKLGDIGAYINVYTDPVGDKSSFYLGLIVKYTPIRFSSIVENTIQTGTLTTKQVSYTPAAGSQLSFMVSCGQHYQITPAFYLRTLGAAGYFRLRGEYKEQYNQINSKNSNNSTTVNSLPKIYLAVFAGYRF